MSHLQTLHLAHLPPSLAIHVAMYRDLKNAPFLREQLLAGNSEFEYALIDASMILSSNHILAATFRAVNDYVHNRLKSKNVHSEIVFSLSPNNNIAESFRRFGITSSTKDLLVIKVSTSPEITHDSVAQHLRQHIEGTPVSFDDATLNNISDVARIKKVYKLSGLAQPKQSKKSDGPHQAQLDGSLGDKLGGKHLEISILGSIALRGAT